MKKIQTKFLVLAGLVLALFSNHSFAQGIGGLPDKKFNVADTGGIVNALNRNNQVFYPGPGGGVHAAKFEKFTWGPQKNKLQLFHYYYSKVGVSDSYSQDFPEPSRSGELLEASPGVYYKAGNWISTGGPAYGFGVDSLLISKHNTTISIPKFNNCFYFRNPFLGNYKTGIVQTTATRLAFWLTYNPNDTLFTYQRHTHTYVRSLDTSCTPLVPSLVIPNFRAIKSATFQGNLYLLGTSEVQNLPYYETKIVVVDGSTLQILPNPFTNLNQSLLDSVGSAQVFSFLPDGKIILAGRLSNGSLITEQAIRLNADGGFDNTFTNSAFSGNNIKWSIDAQGVIRCATILPIGPQNVARMAIVNPNGGFQQTDVPINKVFGLGFPLMYHPYYNAFLFESTDISKDRVGLVYTDGSIINGKRHRFYVGFNGNSWPLVNTDGVGMFGELIRVDVNPTITSKFIAFGNFTQVNKKVMPGLVMMKANGEVDTTFKSSLFLQDDSLRFGIFSGTHTAHLTNSGKVLVSGALYRAYENYRGRYNFMDTLFRLNADGSKDFTYQKPWYHGSLKRAKNGNYYSVRFYENGVPTALPGFGFSTTVKILILNSEGEFIKELGAFTSNGSAPDSSNSNVERYRDSYFEDEQKGLWVQTLHNVPSPGGSSYDNGFFTRFDSLGNTWSFKPNFYLPAPPIKVEILPGKRMRWTGTFGFGDPFVVGNVVNVLETDSTGIMDVGVPTTKFFVPDVYGGRDKFYAAPHRYLPDGKILTFLYPHTIHYGELMIRLKANGNQDNSFMPVDGLPLSGRSFEVIGDRLLLGVQSFNPSGFQNSPGYYFQKNSLKNGLHAFSLKSTPANTGYAQGRVTQIVSPATGCNPTVPQKSARGMLIRSTPSDRIAISDTGGYFTLPLELGNHTVNQTIENNFLQRQVCPVPPVAGHTFSLASAGAASLGNDFINQTYDCPRLDLKVLDPRFRLCSRTSFQIQYQNDGVAPQPNARIRVNLPEEIRILSASRPYTKDVDSSYVFDLGTLQPGQFGTITTVDTIACPAQPDSMARACFSARIEPLSLCSNIDPASILWDGAWLDAVARYNPTTNKVWVVVYNKGNSMADSTTMRLTGPGLIYKNGKIKLVTGDSLVTLCEPAIQGSIQLQLDQPKACPLGSNSRLNHSGRGTARAFLNFGSGLLETYTVQACPIWRFSYDPNEKLVEPSGDIEPGTELDYTIHFENYGNDTAYAVTVEDTLPQGLDVKTIKLGASSDPYTLEMAGTETNPVLYFHFRDIKLTGKKQDSIRSKGQLSFKIRTKPDVARGSVISNRAHIYFDRNEAVITEYIHSPIAELGVDFVSTNTLIKSENKMVIAPNPARGSTKIWFTQSGSRSESKTIRILTMEGKLVKEMQAHGGQAEVKGLLSGIYLITAEGVKPQRLVVIQ